MYWIYRDQIPGERCIAERVRHLGWDLWDGQYLFGRGVRIVSDERVGVSGLAALARAVLAMAVDEMAGQSELGKFLCGKRRSIGEQTVFVNRLSIGEDILVNPEQAGGMATGPTVKPCFGCLVRVTGWRIPLQTKYGFRQVKRTG